jgi:tRNA G18 (ribose-2'-O)-methylase SpoU
MAMNIPSKAFLSFGFKQCVNVFHRMGTQLESQWHKEDKRILALDNLKSHLTELSELSKDAEVLKLVHELLSSFPDCEQSLGQWLMKLERHGQMDLHDAQFLVSTEDTDEIKREVPYRIHLVLDNLRSSFNVGSIFRTAESLGVQTIHLCGYTATPENSKTAKSALGTDDWVEWKYWEGTFDCIEHLKNEGFSLYGLETAKEAVSLSELAPSGPCALVFGNERFGLCDTVLEQMDEVVQIELHGKKNSLNVGSCAAISIYQFSQALSLD